MRIFQRKFYLYLLLALSLSLFCVSAFAQQSWNSWVKQLRRDAISQGVSPGAFDRSMRGIRPDPKVLRYDRTQPEHRITYLKYRSSRVNNQRINMGVREYKKHRNSLNHVSRMYGVSPCFILSFWGMESAYGRYKGHFLVIRSLATLAYDGRRSAFFRKQLIYALKMIDGGHVDPKKLKGEWAGASRHPQFLPSSWYRFAVDHNRDGKRDIWNTYGDVFASIANYVKQNGWQTGRSVMTQVVVPRGWPKSKTGFSYANSVRNWMRMGVRAVAGQYVPNNHTEAWLVRPDGGPDYLVYKNFRVIMTWNRSTYYAGTVTYLANKICRSVR